MTQLRAEIISIGDEMTSGVRLDTNSQWISQKLGEIGIVVAFHTTVGDDISDNVDVFRAASDRADIVVSTGGLGPTADDLTRNAIAEMMNVELIQDDHVLEHIKKMYQSRGREMPPNNVVQALFPAGSKIIPNPEGTAPGIDVKTSSSRIFSLPGVPVEMKQMWNATVEPELRLQTGNTFVIHHHTVHCFGSGESHIETLLPDLVKRGRDPQVGITASAATISLRVSTRGESVEDCQAKMQPTIKTIFECLGDLVYGQNGQQLECAIVEFLNRSKKTVSIFDSGLRGAVASLITERDHNNCVFTGAEVATVLPQVSSVNSAAQPKASSLPQEEVGEVSQFTPLGLAAIETARVRGSDFGLAIGPIERDSRLVDAGESFYSVAISNEGNVVEKEFRYSGHSGWREIRAVKEVLNYFRLYLIEA
ncbi:MAG: competence/damage-inducible protein A [Mariniblastus sp.]